MQITIFLFLLFYSFSPLFSSTDSNFFERYKKKELLSFIVRACIEGNMAIISGFINDQHPGTSLFLHTRYDEQRNTLLHLALKHKQVTIALYLIQQKSPVHLYNRDGWIPLHYAAEQDDAVLFNILIQAGSPINAYAINGITPYGIAKKHSKMHVLTLCKQLSSQHTFKSELDLPQAHKVYLVDEEGNLDFMGWKCDTTLPKHPHIPQETIAERQNYFLQLQKTNSLPSLPSSLHLNIDDRPLWLSEGK